MDWGEAEKQVSENRAEVMETLAQFSLNDVLLFWSDDPAVCLVQEKSWRPVIDLLNDTFGIKLKVTQDLETPKENLAALAQLKSEFEKMSAKELTALYAAAREMRSVYLALALVKGFADAEKAFELSELEELYQAEQWGQEPLAVARRDFLLKSLVEIENYLKS